MITSLPLRRPTRSRFSAWIRRSRRLAGALLLLAFVALGLPAPLLALTAMPAPAPAEDSSWWAQVRDDWDEAWSRAWSREEGQDSPGEDADFESTDSIVWEAEDGWVRFRYEDEGYRGVALTGDWIGWARLPMDYLPEEKRWELSVEIEPGRHHYRFIVEDDEGEWEAIDPANTQALRLDDEGWVSVLVTGGERARELERWRGERAAWRRLKAELARDFGEEDAPLGYQRVDGLVLGIALDHLAEADFELTAKGSIAYGFESERWSAALTVLQPLVPGQRLWLRLRGVSGTGFTPRTGIGEVENSLAAAFFREDYRDYFRREGAEFGLAAAAPSWLRVEAGLRSEDHESLRNTATWSMRSGHFRPNLPVDDGTLRSVYAGLRLGRPFNYLELAWERAGEDVLGGDFDFSLAEAVLRSRLPLGDDQRLDLRLKGGSNLRGALPLQRRFLLGGFGTVRGYDYQSLLVAAPDALSAAYGGERMLLANLEYGVDIFDDLELFALYDAGMAWMDRDADMDLADIKDSAGLGFGSEDAGLRLNVMRTLDGSEETVVELRLERAF